MGGVVLQNGKSARETAVFLDGGFGVNGENLRISRPEGEMLTDSVRKVDHAGMVRRWEWLCHIRAIEKEDRGRSCPTREKF